MSKTRKLYQEQCRAREAMDLKLRVVMREEFPIGARVMWTRTYGKPMLHGEVVDHNPYSATVTVKTVSGARHRVDAHYLEHE